MSLCVDLMGLRRVVVVILSCILWLICAMNNSPPHNPNKFKVDNAKLKIKTFRNEQKLAKNTIAAPVFAEVANPKLVASPGEVIVEFYARKLKAGLWMHFEDACCDSDFSNLAKDMASSTGIEQEMIRTTVDNALKRKLQGNGMGGHIHVVNKIKTALPQLKKLRPTDVCIGYKIMLSEDEPIYSFPPVSSAKEKAAHKHDPKIDFLAVLAANNTIALPTSPTSPTSLTTTALSTSLQALARGLTDREVDSLLMFSDGSACFEDNVCRIASAGVFVLPCRSNRGHGSGSGSGSGHGSYLSPLRPLSDIACSFRIDEAASAVSTPFDAELLAGLAGTCIALNILHEMEHLQQSESEAAVDNADDTEAADGRKLSISLITDSKTLLRAFRTGSTNDLASREGSLPCREMIWKRMESNQHSLVNKRHVEWSVVWQEGHPERRKGNPLDWTLEEAGMWVADDVADWSRPSTGAEGSGGSRGSESGSGKAVAEQSAAMASASAVLQRPPPCVQVPRGAMQGPSSLRDKRDEGEDGGGDGSGGGGGIPQAEYSIPVVLISAKELLLVAAPAPVSGKGPNS